MAGSTRSITSPGRRAHGNQNGGRYRTATVDGLEIFYREAGPIHAPLLVLLHGFPSASHQYTALIDRLSDQFHLLAPDYRGFGHNSAPASNHAGGKFACTFDHLADVTEHWLARIGAKRFFMYVFEFGAPIGYRIASRCRGMLLAYANVGRRHV